MFQWLIEVEIVAHDRELGSSEARAIVRKAFEEFGPPHATEADAKAWIRRAELATPGPDRLASPPVRTRTITVIEGLDDEPAEVASLPAAATAPARRERPRCPHCEKVVTDKATVAGETVAHDGSTWHRACFAELSPATQADIAGTAAPVVEQVPAEVANAPAEPIPMVAAGVGEARHAELAALVHMTTCAVCRQAKPTRAPWRHVADVGPVCADCNAAHGVPIKNSEPAPSPDGPIDPGPDTPDAPPVVAAAELSPAADLAAAVATPRSSTEPTVDVRGEVLEVFDGKAWYWQKYQRADTAEKTARKAMELITTGGNLGGVTVMMKAGRAPALKEA